MRWINTWHDPIIEKEAAASLFDAGAQVVFTGADTPAVADVAEEKGKWGVTYDWYGSCKVDACLTAPYWIWGPVYAEITQGLVMVSTSKKVITVRPVSHDLKPQELSRFISSEVDIILTEGFKESHTFKIEVLRDQDNDVHSSAKELLAVVTDKPADIDVPQYSKKQVKSLADLVEERLSPKLGQDELELVVNGEFIKMNPFVHSILSSTFLGFINGLKGVGEVKNFQVSFRKRAID